MIQYEIFISKVIKVNKKSTLSQQLVMKKYYLFFVILLPFNIKYISNKYILLKNK